MKTNTFFVQLSVVLLFVAALVTSSDIEWSSFRDLLNIDDKEAAALLSQEEVDVQQERQLEGAGDRLFGDRCGNRRACSDGFDCADAFLGDRCLPNACLEENSQEIQEVFDIDKLYQNAGVTKEEVFAKLAEVRNERAFLKTYEFRALSEALRTNLEPMKTAAELRKSCIDQYQHLDRQDTNTTASVSYIGLHIEAGAIVDATVQYLFANNGTNDIEIIRICAGAELGAGAEISYIFGFSDAETPEGLKCAAVFFDIDIVAIVAGGAAIGWGFNGNFMYEFTVGGGAGAGLGGAWCAGFEYFNGTIVF